MPFAVIFGALFLETSRLYILALSPTNSLGATDPVSDFILETTFLFFSLYHQCFLSKFDVSNLSRSLAMSSKISLVTIW